MGEQERIICALAAIDIARLEHDDGVIDRVKGLIVSSRVLEEKIGLQTRSADAAGRNDDYEAVMQMALSIGYDGKLHTYRRSDCPPYAIIPMLAAAKHLLYTMTHELAKKLDMSDCEMDKATEIIIRSIVREEFEAAWESVKQDDTDGSRTTGGCNIEETGGSGLRLTE